MCLAVQTTISDDYIAWELSDPWCTCLALEPSSKCAWWMRFSAKAFEQAKFLAGLSTQLEGLYRQTHKPTHVWVLGLQHLAQQESAVVRPASASATVVFDAFVTQTLNSAICWCKGSCARRRSIGHGRLHLDLEHQLWVDAHNGWPLLFIWCVSSPPFFHHTTQASIHEISRNSPQWGIWTVLPATFSSPFKRKISHCFLP